MIKELNSLTWFVHENHPRAEPFLGFLCEEKTEVMHLYRAIRDNAFKTDEEAIEKAQIGERTSYKKYGKILESHLCDILLAIDYGKSKVAGGRKTKLAAVKKLALVRICASIPGKHLSLRLAEEVYEESVRNEWPEIAVEALLIWRASCIVAGVKLQQLAKIQEQYHEQRRHTDWYFRASECFDLHKSHFVHKKGIEPEHREQLGEWLAELAPHVGTIPSYNFHIWYFLMKIDHCAMSGAYAEVLAITEQAVAYLNARGYPVENEIIMFRYNQLIPLYRLERYKEAESCALLCLEEVSKGTSNWFNLYEIYFYCCLHAGWLDKAAAIYHQVVQHRQFPMMRETQHESWVVLGAYLHIALSLNRDAAVAAKLPKFKPARFLNDVPTLALDKHGMNVAILVAHAALYLMDGQTDLVWERINALRKYGERYLATEDMRRCNAIVRLLSALAKHGHDRADLAAAAVSPLAALRQVPLSISMQPHEMEVLPWERLFDGLAECIK